VVLLPLWHALRRRLAAASSESAMLPVVRGDVNPGGLNGPYEQIEYGVGADVVSSASCVIGVRASGLATDGVQNTVARSYSHHGIVPSNTVDASVLGFPDADVRCAADGERAAWRWCERDGVAVAKIPFYETARI
jgi:hypothetical protein